MTKFMEVAKLKFHIDAEHIYGSNSMVVFCDLSVEAFFSCSISNRNQLLQLCTTRSVLSILVSVRLHVDIGLCTVTHCDAGGVSLFSQ